MCKKSLKNWNTLIVSFPDWLVEKDAIGLLLTVLMKALQMSPIVVYTVEWTISGVPWGYMSVPLTLGCQSVL